MLIFTEGSIDTPAGWRDNSINIVSSAGPMEQGLTLTVTRDDIPFGMSFDEYSERQIETVQKALKDFALNAKRPMVLDNAAAYEIECHWVSKQGRMHQLIYTVAVPGGARALVLTTSMPGQMTESQLQEARRMVTSLRLNRG